MAGVEGVLGIVEEDESSQTRRCRALTCCLGRLNSGIGNGEPWKVLEQRSSMMNS